MHDNCRLPTNGVDKQYLKGLQSVTKFVGTVHDYADLTLSQLTLPSQCCFNASFSAHLPKQHCGRARYCKVFQQFCPGL